jgi:hypothetical protein
VQNQNTTYHYANNTGTTTNTIRTKTNKTQTQPEHSWANRPHD